MTPGAIRYGHERVIEAQRSSKKWYATLYHTNGILNDSYGQDVRRTHICHAPYVFYKVRPGLTRALSSPNRLVIVSGGEFLLRGLTRSTSGRRRREGRQGKGKRKSKQAGDAQTSSVGVPLVQDAFARMHEKWGRELNITATHKFRHWGDVLLPYLHHYYVMHEGSKCCGFLYKVAPGRIPFCPVSGPACPSGGSGVFECRRAIPRPPRVCLREQSGRLRLRPVCSCPGR